MICYEFWRAWSFFADGVATLVFLGKWILVLLEDEQKLSVGDWSPYHPSCQNLTLFPNPTTSWQFLLKSSHPMRIPLHKPHPWTPLPSFEVHPPQSSPYFEATTVLHNRSSSFPNHHNHFPNKALLKVVSFLIPKPQLAIGAQTLSHPTKTSLYSPTQQQTDNFYWNPSNPCEYLSTNHTHELPYPT